ncbi:MAG: hypothetical protein AAF696_20465 [Bacteroidota bacterium]
MHLSKELQQALKRLGSSIELAKTIEGDLPENYVYYYPDTDRNFRLDFTRSTEEYALVLFDKMEVLNYEFCQLRGLFTSLSEVALLLKNWIEDAYSMDKLASSFPGLESFELDEYEHPDPTIEARWRYVKNRIFNDTAFWKQRDWEERYMKMLHSAKRKEAWKNYYPFTSHNLLRFSLNNELTYVWELSLSLVPCWNTERGNYQLGLPEAEKNKMLYFDKLEDAINSFEEKLKEYAPRKYG